MEEINYLDWKEIPSEATVQPSWQCETPIGTAYIENQAPESFSLSVGVKFGYNCKSLEEAKEKLIEVLYKIAEEIVILLDLGGESASDMLDGAEEGAEITAELTVKDSATGEERTIHAQAISLDDAEDIKDGTFVHMILKSGEDVSGKFGGVDEDDETIILRSEKKDGSGTSIGIRFEWIKHLLVEITEEPKTEK